MTNRKTNNSILFLTTLSVYLGLVLVGGSPSVFAQAALTPRFELVNEFEVEDDLDKKPDDEQILAEYGAVCDELLRLAKQFTETNRDALSSSQYSFDYSVLTDPQSALTMRSLRSAGIHWGGFTRPITALGKTFPNSAKANDERFRVTLEYSESGFSVNTVFHQAPTAHPEQLAAFYDIIKSRRIAEDDPQLIIFKNTSITFENNQIVVVTRLPRASIDELLAETQSK